MLLKANYTYIKVFTILATYKITIPFLHYLHSESDYK